VEDLKDFYTTKVIRTLTNVKDEYFELVFQGGTSLSKGYQIVRRMSEDVDFRVIKKPAARKFGKEALRKKLRNFRYGLVQALQDADFKVPKEGIRTFYEGRFMSIRAEFNGSEKITYLKPHVAIECFMGELALEPQSAEITTLIKLTLGQACIHPSFPVTCVALDETAAEKWVALTRRIANTQIHKRQSDKHLVRHLYDLYHLNMSGLLTNDYCNLIYDIMQKDRTQFKKHNSAYVDDPIHTSKVALDLLFKDHQWRHHWNDFLEQMVYEENKPSFDTAYDHLQSISQNIFKKLELRIPLPSTD